MRTLLRHGAKACAAGLLVATMQVLPGHASTPVPIDDAGTVVGWGLPSEVASITLPSDLASTAFTQIAAAANVTFGLTASGELRTWGSHVQGLHQLPQQVRGRQVKFIDASPNYAVAVMVDGSVIGWGYPSPLGTPSDVPPGLTNVEQVAVANQSAFALRADGTVVGWGRNEHGVLPAPTDLTGVRALAAGATHVYALLEDGTVAGWGRNQFGQLDLPPELLIEGNVQQIEARNGGGLALLQDGSLLSWGQYTNVTGTGSHDVPGSLAGVEIAQISAGNDDNLVLDVSGGLHAWGVKPPPSQQPIMYTVPGDLTGASIAGLATGTNHYVVLVSGLYEAVKPTVSGVAREGQTLSAVAGTFSGVPDSVSSEWLSNGVSIPGATGPSLTLTAAHVGKRISYRSTAVKGSESVSSTSVQTAAVAGLIVAPPPPPPPTAKAVSKLKVAKTKVKKRGKNVVIRVRVTAKGKAKPTGKVKIVIKRGKKKVAQANVKINAKGVAKLPSKKLKKKQARQLTKRGKYKITATYKGSATVLASKGKGAFKV